MTDVLVLGAGPAGLTAAWRAARTGRSVIVLERSGSVGGLSASFTVADVRVDHGSHRLHPSVAPHILEELRRLLGNDLQTRVRHGRIRLDGRWIDFPLRAVDAARHLPFSFTAGVARDTAFRSRRAPADDTFADVLLARFGPTLCKRFYFPYARKLWGLEPEQIAGDQARRRVSAPSPLQILRRALTGGPNGKVFLYPRHGFGQLWEAIANAATDAGADIRLQTPVNRIVGTSVDVADTTFDAERIWSTLPLASLARLAGADERTLASAAQLRSRAMVLVYLVMPVAHVSSFDAHYLPESWTPVSRISEPKNYRSGTDSSESTVLCAEIACGAADTVFSSSDDALVGIALDAVARSGITNLQHIDAVIKRIPNVYPIHDLDYATHAGVVERWVAAQPHLLTFGRQGLFVHDNSHHALAMGWAAAQSLTDSSSWAAARQQFRTHVVED